MEEVWAILGVGATLLAAILGTWYASRTDNREAHRGIRENIGRVEEKVDNGFSAINNDIKGLNRSIGRLEGRNRTTDDGASV